MNKNKEKLLALLNIDEQSLNYSLKDNKLYHNKTGLLEESFLMNRLIKVEVGDVWIVYNKQTDTIYYRSHTHSRHNITFDRYEVIDSHLYLFHNNHRYIIKAAGSYLFNKPDYGQILLIEGGIGSHMATYRAHKQVHNERVILGYRLQYIGYPKEGDLDIENYDGTPFHSFECIEEIDNNATFIADAYLDYEFNLTSNYTDFLQSAYLKDKLNTYKNGMSLLSAANEIYTRHRGKIYFFIDDKGQLDFTTNMSITHQLNNWKVWYHIDNIIQHKEKFSSPLFLNFISSFQQHFDEYFKKNEFFVDINIESVDDLETYRSLIDMSKI